MICCCCCCCCCFFGGWGGGCCCFWFVVVVLLLLLFFWGVGCFVVVCFMFLIQLQNRTSFLFFRMNKKSIMIKFHLAQTSTQCATIITFIVQQSLCVNLMVWDNILCWNAFTSLQGKCFPSMLFFAWGSWGLPYSTQSHRHIISRKSPQGYHAKWAFIKCHILLFSTDHWTASLHLNTSKRVQAGPQRFYLFF